MVLANWAFVTIHSMNGVRPGTFDTCKDRPHIFPAAHKDWACTCMKDMASTCSPTGTEAEINEGSCPMRSETNAAVPPEPNMAEDTTQKALRPSFSAFRWMQQNRPHSTHHTHTQQSAALKSKQQRWQLSAA